MSGPSACTHNVKGKAPEHGTGIDRAMPHEHREGNPRDSYPGTARLIPDSRARQARDESMKCWSPIRGYESDSSSLQRSCRITRSILKPLTGHPPCASAIDSGDHMRSRRWRGSRQWSCSTNRASRTARSSVGRRSLRKRRCPASTPCVTSSARGSRLRSVIASQASGSGRHDRNAPQADRCWLLVDAQVFF